MVGGGRQAQVWKFSNRHGEERKSPLEAYWEVHLDPISDDYTPEEADAFELLEKWSKKANQDHPNGLIPISWSVQGKATFEAMPFQFEHFPGQLRETFLTFFTWPVNCVTGEQLNWLTLPVVDKMWNSKRANKGGFIQQATGWKPAILQPYVYLPALLSIPKR